MWKRLDYKQVVGDNYRFHISKYCEEGKELIDFWIGKDMSFMGIPPDKLIEKLQEVIEKIKEMEKEDA